VEPAELDKLAEEAHGAEALMATLRAFDMRGARPKSFAELATLLRDHFVAAAHRRAQSLSVAAAAAAAAGADGTAAPVGSFHPAATHAPLSPDDSTALVAYISSEQCQLFAVPDASGDLVVEPAALDALFAAGGCEIGAVIATLHKMDACGRRFARFDDLIPALAEARETGCHCGPEAQQRLLDYLGGESCRLFAEPAGGAPAELEVSLDALDALVAAAAGVDGALAALQSLEAQGKQVSRFDELVPLVKQHVAAQQQQAAQQPQQSGAPVGAAPAAAAAADAEAPAQ